MNIFVDTIEASASDAELRTGSDFPAGKHFTVLEQVTEKWTLVMRNLEQIAIFQLETFRTDQKEASAYDEELRTANEIPAGKLLEQIKSMTEAGIGGKV